jgi:hypothetical protein
MRANLYSLQNTAQLMATTQGRLSTGKKVNSALDDPNNYFASQSLTNRASDLTALLDGMGQAIQALTTASQGITSAQKIVDQMKSVANSAAQAITTSSNANGTNVVAYTTLGTSATQGTLVAAGTAGASGYALTDLTSSTSTTSLGVLNGDQMTVQVGTGATYTFTVGASAANNSTVGNGGGTTTAELATWLTTVGAGAVTYGSGAITLATTASTVTISGKLATELGITEAGTTGLTGSVDLGVMQYTNQAAASGSTLLSNLRDGTAAGTISGSVLLNTATTHNGTSTGAGSYLSLAVSGGQTKTINITATTTVQNVLDSINSISGLTASLDPQGNLKVVNANSTAVTIDGTASGLLGKTASIAANGSVTQNIVEGYGQVVSANVPTTALTNLQAPSGQARIAKGDQLNVTVNGVTTSITLNDLATTAAGAQTATTVSNVSGLMSALGQISGVTATLNSTNGQLSISSSSGQAITFSGNAAAKLSLPASVAAGQTSVGGSGVSAASVQQFDTLRTQLDQLVQDASYKGINLLSGTGNNPLKVVFNEQATNANSLTINSVDLTTKGLGIAAATGNWTDTATIQASLSQLTAAASTLRTDSATFGQNLTSVQTRQDFTNNMIATLKTGADNLTLADMNEESANMLALQTRQQLGTQSLSLASQANQAVMRLFG